MRSYVCLGTQMLRNVLQGGVGIRGIDSTGSALSLVQNDFPDPW